MNIMFVANTAAILKLRIFSGRYHFRLWVFTSTGEYFYYWHWRVLPKVLKGKWFQDLQKHYHFTLCTHKLYVYCRMVHFTGTFKNHVDLVIIGSDQKDITLYVLDPFHLKRANNNLSKLNQSIYHQDHAGLWWKKHLLIWNSVITKTLTLSL